MTSSYRGYARASDNLNSGKVIDPSQKILQRNKEFLEDYRRVREFERQQEAFAFQQYQKNTQTQTNSQVDAANLQANYGKIVSDQQQANVQKKQAAMQKAFDRKAQEPSNWEKTLSTTKALVDLSATANKLYGDYKKAEELAKTQTSTTARYKDPDPNRKPQPPVTANTLIGSQEQRGAARAIASENYTLSAVQQSQGELPGAIDSANNAKQSMAAVVEPAQMSLRLRQGFLPLLNRFDGTITTDQGEEKLYKSLPFNDQIKYYDQVGLKVFKQLGLDLNNVDDNVGFELAKEADEFSTQYFSSLAATTLKAARSNAVDDQRTLFQADPSPINVQGLYVALQQQANGDDSAARNNLFDEFKSFNYDKTDVDTFLDAKVPGLNKSWREQFPGDAQDLLNARSTTGIQNAQAEDNARELVDIQRANAIEEAAIKDLEDGVYNAASGEELSEQIAKYTAQGDTQTAAALTRLLPMTPSAQNDTRVETQFEELLLNGIQGDLTPKMVLESGMSNEKKTEWLGKVKQFDATSPNKTENDRAKKYISDSINSRAKWNEYSGKTKDPSINRAIDSAMDQYQADYKQAMLQDGMSIAEAQKYALGRFQEEFGTDPIKGRYRLGNPLKGQPDAAGTSFIDPSFTVQAQKEGIYDYNRATLNRALKVPNAIDQPGLIQHDVLKDISVQSLQRKGMPASIQFIAARSNKPAFEILNRQLKANGLAEIPEAVYSAAEEAQGVVTGELQSLLNQYPAPTRTDIAMIGSGQEPIYSQRIPPSVESDVEFQREVAGVSQRLGVSANDLFAIMDFETGGSFDPAIRNAAGSGATGLIQIMPSTAVALGTTTEALASMSRIEQLGYVEKYFQRTGIQPGSNLSDLYMAVLFPAAVGKGDDFVLFGNGAMSDYQGNAYTQNRGLDSNGDGSVTKGEATAKVLGSANPWRQRRNLNPAVVSAQASAPQTRTKEQGPGSGYWKWDEQRNLWVKSNAN